HREAGRVPTVEPSVVVDVRLREDVDLLREARRERVDGRPVVEDAPVHEVVCEGEVAVLVDGEVPRDLPQDPERGEEEERYGGDEPECRERVMPGEGRERAPRRRRGRSASALGAGAAGTTCGRRWHRASYQAVRERGSRKPVAARAPRW